MSAPNDTLKPALEDALPQTCLPTWDVGELPEPKRLGPRNLPGFIGPGIAMCGIQPASGEWLLGAEITARYGGSLMWIAGIAALDQVFLPQSAINTQAAINSGARLRSTNNYYK